jgi:hypothetical protein
MSRAFNTVPVPGTLWSYVLASAIIKFLTAKGFTPIFLDVWDACTVKVPFMLAQTLGPSFFKGGRKGPWWQGSQPRQRRRRVDTLFRGTAASRDGDWTPQNRTKTRPLWPSPQKLATERSVQGGCRIQNISKQQLCRTSPAQWERRRCLNTQEQLRRWTLGSSQRPTDEKTNQWNDIISRRHARKKCKVQTSTGEVVVSVFGGSEGIVLVKFLYRGTTIQSGMSRH